MTQSTTLNFLIRDGLDADIDACLRLDHVYETDSVWQMHIRQEDGWMLQFKKERLPRTLAIEYPAGDDRIRAALPADQCFLVATRREEEEEILGYLTMHSDAIHRIGMIYDIVVSRPYRRNTIASRLVKVAARWAKEHNLTRLMVETQTTNYPAIEFCQATGFTFCGFNDRYFPNQDIAVFFSQSLR